MNPHEIIIEAVRLLRQYERDARHNAFRTHKGSDTWKLHDAQRQEAKDMADRLEVAGQSLTTPPIPLAMTPPPGARWRMGDFLRKVRGSSWRGPVCGFYTTENTPVGYCIESAFEPGSVQCWPEAALVPGDPLAAPGWIVGNGNQTAWRSWDHVGNPCWVPDKADATRYARRQDAELVHREDEDAWAVVLYETEDGQ